MKESILCIYDHENIFSILHYFDTLFDPALSHRFTNLAKYAEKLACNAIFYVAKDTDFLGFIAFYANDNDSRTAYLILLAVQPVAQSKGLAKKLLDLCIETSKNNGMLTLKLEVRKNNCKAIRFYKRNGFEFCGEASFESVYMVKSL